jgi:hypothetical protein
LEESLKELKQALKQLCNVYGIEDLSGLHYQTIAINHTEITKNGKTYKRIQLKGYNQKTKTITSWKEGEEPMDLYKLVNLYRACKYLSKACDYLFGT